MIPPLLRRRSGVLLWLAAALAVPPFTAEAQPMWRIDTATSRIVAHVMRKGLLSPVLHDHHFVPERWRGTLAFDPDRPGELAVEVVIEAASLRDQQPKLSPADRQQVEAELRSARFLDVARYPDIRFTADRLDQIERAGAGAIEIKGRLLGHLTIRDVTAPIEMKVAADIEAQRLRASGEAVFRQSQFGIRPLSRLLGAIGVEDRVRVEVSIDAVTERPAQHEARDVRLRVSRAGRSLRISRAAGTASNTRGRDADARSGQEYPASHHWG